MLHDIWLLYGIQDSVCVIKFYWSASTLSYYILSVAALEFQQQSWVVAMETMRPTMAKIVFIWLLKEKVGWSLDQLPFSRGTEAQRENVPRSQPASGWNENSGVPCECSFHSASAQKQINKFLSVSWQWPLGPLICFLSAHSHTQAQPSFQNGPLRLQPAEGSPNAVTAQCQPPIPEPTKIESMDILSCPARRTKKYRAWIVSSSFFFPF